jgi:hypothetical protein
MTKTSGMRPPPKPSASSAASSSMPFIALRKHWASWLDGDGAEYSIWSQIRDMVWRDTVWRTINEARRLTANGAYFAQNGLVAEFIDRSYVESQALAVGRLVDRTKNVVSLWRLVQEIGNKRTAITREAYLSAQDLPYDVATTKAAHFERMLAKAKNGVVVSWEKVGGPTDWSSAEWTHALFDQLSGVSEDKRKPTDVVSRKVPHVLYQWLDDPAIAKLNDLRHSHIAHAGANTKSGAQSGLTMADVTAAQRALFRTANAVSSLLLHHSTHSTALAVPQFNQFVHWDKPMMSGDDIIQLHNWWDGHAKQHSEFAKGIREELLAAMHKQQS